MMKLTEEQNLELKKTNWNKVGKKDDECLWIKLYSDEMLAIAWKNLCKLTGHDVEDGSIKLLVIGKKK